MGWDGMEKRGAGASTHGVFKAFGVVFVLDTQKQD